MSANKNISFFNMDDINVDDEFDALSAGMDEEEDNEEGSIDEETLAGIKQLEDEIDDEEKQKTEGIHQTADAWKADYSNQPETVATPQPQPIATPTPQPQPQPIQQQQVQMQPPQQQLPTQPPPQQQLPIQPTPQQQPPMQPPQQQVPAQNNKQPVQQAPQAPQKKVQNQPQKPQAAQPQKASAPPKPKPKPKPAPRNFINETSSSQEYNELFETFADTFYSMIHSKSNQQKYFEQIEKILPMIANGPSQPIKNDLDLSRPKLKAPAHRDYNEFKKKSISTATDQKEIDKVIKEIEEQIEVLKKDAKLLISLKLNNFATYIIGQMKALKLSTIRMREEPYYISDVFHYYVPDINSDIPLNTIRINIISGTGFPKDDIIIAILLPIRGQGFFRVNTPCVKGPNPNFNYQVDVPITGLRDPTAFTRFQKESSTIGVYINVGKEIPKESEPKAISVMSTGFLYRHKALSCPAITFEDLPGAQLHIECITHHAIAKPEMKAVDMRIKCSPFVSFAKKSKKEAAAAASQKGTITNTARQTENARKQQTANSTAHKVQPAKAEMRSQEEIKKKQKTPIIYVFTDEELKMFWPGELVMFVTDAAKKVVNIAKVKGEEPQKGLIPMIQTLESNWKKIEESVGNETISQEQYMDMVVKAIDREQKRLPSIPQDDRETHEGFLNLMQNELNVLKQQMEEDGE